jgi:hypothetical protein
MSDIIWEKIKNFKTKHESGFTSQEIVDFLKESYPKIERKDFNLALGIHTAMFIDGESITYHSDVELAVKCCLEDRKPNIFEWD